MFRSLLIGFLILSTLTSKGVGVQINHNISISADILLDFYNAAVAYAEQQADFADAKKDSAYFCSSNETAIAIQRISRSATYNSPTAWAENDSHGCFGNKQSGAFVQCLKSSCDGEIYSRGSDTSPPYTL